MPLLVDLLGDRALKTMFGLMLVVAALGSGLASAQDGQPLEPLVSEVNGHGDQAPQPSQTQPPTKSADTAPAAKTPDLVIDREGLRLTIPGTITGTTGLIELGATSNPRRRFLAAIVAKVRPSRIVEAMKSLGVEPGKVPEADPAAQTATEPQGRKVALTVHWDAKVGDETLHRQVPLEQLFWDRGRDEPLPLMPWIFAGSSTVRNDETGGEMFVGDLSGSVATISLMDTSAVFYYGGNLRPGSSRHANPNLKVAAGVPCSLEVRILPQEAPVENQEQPPKTEPPAEEKPAPAPPPATESPAAADDETESQDEPAADPNESPAAAPPAAQ